MITASGLNKSGQFILIGLTPQNLQNLKEGKPIELDANMLGFEGTIVIVAGPTEESIIDQIHAKNPHLRDMTENRTGKYDA